VQRNLLTFYRVPILLLTKNSRTFQDPQEKISITCFGACKCLNSQKKRHLLTIFIVKSIAENSARSKVWTSAVQNSDERILYFSFEPLENALLSRIFFQNFPGPGIINFQEASEKLRTLTIFISCICRWHKVVYI